MVSIGDVQRLHDSILQNGNYVPTDFSQSSFDQCVEEYKHICGEICDGLEFGSDLFHHLTVDISRVGSTLVSLLDMTIKSHKDFGKVMPRPIHGCSLHAFSGGMRYLSYKIRQSLGDCHHVIKDSDDFIRTLASIHVQDTDHLINIDVKDFS